MYDVKNITKNAASTGQVMWFNVAAYDPIHITGDMMVTYQ